MIKEYNSLIDYKDLCIQFACKKEKTNTNLKHWEEVYKNIDESQKACNLETNIFWYYWLLRDLETYKKHAKIDDAINEYMHQEGQSPDMWAFITVGFNPEVVTVEKMVNACKKVREMNQWIYCDNVLEKHRIDGEHHHAHFLVKVIDPKIYFASKLAEIVFKKIYSRKDPDLVRNKSKVDVKGPCKKKEMHAKFEVYYNYVRGKKKEEKIPYVEKDAIWRKENGIDDLYEKV